jgi:hypothetical protein
MTKPASQGSAKQHCSDADAILPTSIEHRVDKEGGQADYNYIFYHFEEADGTYMWARFYLDTPTRVTMAGPFIEKGDNCRPVGNDRLAQRVRCYLEQRFSIVDQIT